VEDVEWREEHVEEGFWDEWKGFGWVEEVEYAFVG